MADSIADVCDVCIVGVGGMGGIMAKELASAGLKVVGFERGPAPKKEDYAPRDSIRFLIRPEHLEWVRHARRREKKPDKKPTCNSAPVP
jgi:choline dehydrogenase-like flavoprotein